MAKKVQQKRWRFTNIGRSKYIEMQKNTLIISVHQRRGFFFSFKHKGSSHVVTRWLVECLLPNSVLAYGGPCSLKGTFVSRRNKMQCRGPRRTHRAAKDSRQAPCGHFCPKVVCSLFKAGAIVAAIYSQRYIGTYIFFFAFHNARRSK